MRTTIAAGLLTMGLALAGCGADDEPAAEPTASSSPSPSAATQAEDEGVVVEVEIADGAVEPQGGRVEVGVGEPVTLRVSTDAAEEVHVHSDPEVTMDLAAGDTAEETFTIDTPGRVAVEAHDLGVTIVQLVVRP